MRRSKFRVQLTLCAVVSLIPFHPYRSVNPATSLAARCRMTFRPHSRISVVHQVLSPDVCRPLLNLAKTSLMPNAFWVIVAGQCDFRQESK